MAHRSGVQAPAVGNAASWAAAVARRALDVVIPTLVLLCLLPALLVVALLIKLDTRGPVLFRQRRLGKDMRPFTVLKFRTMVADASSEPHRRYIEELANGEGGDGSTLRKLTDDPRVTRVGRTLRRLSIDELPQLLNVLGGQMALVGPRPAIEYELRHYEPAHFARFNVRPGITGLWQVSGRSKLDFKNMLDLDVQYALRPTFATDVRILVRTLGAAFRNAA
jgi:lipopolysaccharide/colanic/teichoic acid biosynthesis glycosyltransferase